MEWQGEVALVKSKELNDKGILAVNVNDSVSWEILCSYAEREKFKSIVVVETRNMVRRERKRRKKHRQ